MIEQASEQAGERLAHIHRQIRAIGPVMRGSVTIMGTRHKQPYFSTSIRGRTGVIYLGDERAKKARQYVANYRRLTGLVEEMTLLQMALLKKMRVAAERADESASPMQLSSDAAAVTPPHCGTSVIRRRPPARK